MDFSNYHYCISTIPLFQTLTRDQIEKIQAQIQVKKFKAGQYLYQAGDDSEYVVSTSEGSCANISLICVGKGAVYSSIRSGRLHWRIRIVQPPANKPLCQGGGANNGLQYSARCLQRCLASKSRDCYRITGRVIQPPERIRTANHLDNFQKARPTA